MAKLKFNLLELTSKRVFLDKLMPSGTLSPTDLLSQQSSGGSSQSNTDTLSLYDEWTNCQTRWTPGDLKELERIVEARKSELKAVKEAVAAVKEEIGNVSGHVVGAKGALDADRDALSLKLKTIAKLEGEVHTLQSRLTELASRSRLPTGMSRCGSCEDAGSLVGEMVGIRAPEELRAELAQLAAAKERKLATIAAHRASTTELQRLLAHHTGDLAQLAADETSLHATLHAKQAEKESHAEAALEQLCVWYRSAIEVVGEATGMHFEMVRPDYILVTFKGCESGNII